MDTVDDLFQPYQLTHWDAPQFPAFTAPQVSSPDDPPDPAAAMFTSDANDHVSIHDPHQISLDISPVTSGLNFPLPNPISFLSNPSPSPPPAQLQQFSHPVEYSQSQHATQHQPQRDSIRQQLQHLPHSQQQLSHQPPLNQPVSHMPQGIRQPSHGQPQGTHSSQQEAQSMRLRQGQQSQTLPPQRHNSQQHSQNAQIGLFQPQQRPHSNTMQSSADGIPHSSQASHQQPLAIDSSQPQLSLHNNMQQQRLSASSQQQQQNRDIEQQLQQQLQLQYQMQQSSMLPQQQQQKQPRSPARRKAASQQRHQNATTASQRKHLAAQGQTQRRQVGAQRPISKQKGGRQVKPQAGRQQKQVPQPQPPQPEKQQQQAQQSHLRRLDFGLMASHQDAQVLQNSRGQRQQQQTQQSQQQHQQQSQQNLFSAMTPAGSSVPGVSSISIPTATTATGTTITGTPSATNSTHRSPPRTPHSSNRGKTSAVSVARETQSDVHSSMDKNTDQPGPKHQSIATTNAKHSQSSSRLDTQATASASASAQHPGLGTATRVIKPRDKQAKLRKRLKCCSHEQLVEQMIGLVRSNAVSEKIVTDSVARVDMNSYVSKCKSLLEAIRAQLPEDHSTASSPYGSDAHRRCKKALMAFKSSVTNMGKTLVEASLWIDVIRYCVEAAAVNDETPVWAETSHNKSRTSVLNKLEQFAARAATAIAKSKVFLFSSADEHSHVTDICRKSFPAVATKLEGLNRGAVVKSGVQRVQDFDDPMISHTRLDLAM